MSDGGTRFRNALIVATMLIATFAAAARADTVPEWMRTDARADTREKTDESERVGESRVARESTDRVRLPGPGPFLEEFVITPNRRAETMDERAANFPSAPGTESVSSPARESQPQMGAPNDDFPVESMGSRYGLQPSDVLMVTVWREADLEREVAVSPDGWISYPLLGEIHVEGKTVMEVRAQIEAGLSRIMADPVVSVSLLQTFGNRVYVLGKVNNPGVYGFAKHLDVIQALTLAGGTSKFANADEIKILRRDNGAQTTYEFNYTSVQKGRKLDQNILLQSGDVVMVP